jgi:hypothetical protein
VIRTLLSLAPILHAERRARGAIGAEFATVPHPEVLSLGLSPKPRYPLRRIACYACGGHMRTGEPVAVRRLAPGRWAHVTCPTRARVPRGGRTVVVGLRRAVEVCRG